MQCAAEDGDEIRCGHTADGHVAIEIIQACGCCSARIDLMPDDIDLVVAALQQRAAIMRAVPAGALLTSVMGNA